MDDQGVVMENMKRFVEFKVLLSPFFYFYTNGLNEVKGESAWLFSRFSGSPISGAQYPHSGGGGRIP